MNVNNDELFEQFKAEWPYMFENVECGFYLPAAWTYIVWGLCQQIDWESRLNTSSEMEPVVVSQVKSKFGGLRFYYSGGNEAIHYYVSLAEQLSHKVCGRCGVTDKSKIPPSHSFDCIQTI